MVAVGWGGERENGSRTHTARQIYMHVGEGDSMRRYHRAMGSLAEEQKQSHAISRVTGPAALDLFFTDLDTYRKLYNCTILN